MTESGIFWLTFGLLTMFLVPPCMWAMDRLTGLVSQDEALRNLVIDKAILIGRVRSLRRRLRRKRRLRKPRVDTRHLEKVR